MAFEKDSDDVRQVEHGSVSPAPHRLEHNGLMRPSGAVAGGPERGVFYGPLESPKERKTVIGLRLRAAR